MAVRSGQRHHDGPLAVRAALSRETRHSTRRAYACRDRRLAIQAMLIDREFSPQLNTMGAPGREKRYRGSRSGVQIVSEGSRAVYLAENAQNQSNYLDFVIRKPRPRVSADLATTGTALALGSRKPPPRTTAVTSVGQGDTAAET